MQQVDDPPYLSVGTEVSAKYKGAFCEAKVRKVVRNIKCKVAYKQGLGTGTVSDDQIKCDLLRVGATVEVKHPDRREYIEATITKIQDYSQYTVVFDDGDITTLRRSALCLKSGRHFNESETLDQLPLTHPEHFGNPVIGGRRGRSLELYKKSIVRSRHTPDESSDEDVEVEPKPRLIEKEEHIGKIICVESTDTKKKGPKENWFPALVVAPTAQDTVRIHVKDEYLVRSFKDGRYYTVPKKEATEFTRDQASKQDTVAVQAALEYLHNDCLPTHWDREVLFGLGNSSSDFYNEFDSDSSDDEPNEEKDHFVAQLYKYMDDRGTPLNKGPSIINKDVDLYRLYRAVQKLGGYNRVTSQNQWKQIAIRLGFVPTTTSIQNLVKQAYKKFLLPFEEFDRKLGCTMVAHPRANRIKGRSLVRANSVASPKLEKESKSTTSAAEESENTSESSVDTGKPKLKQTGKIKTLMEPYEKEEVEIKQEPKDEKEMKLPRETGPRQRDAKEALLTPGAKMIDVPSTSSNKKEKSNKKQIIPIIDERKGKKKPKEIEAEKPKKEPGEEKDDTVQISINVGDKLRVYYHEQKVTYEAKVLEISRQGENFLYLVHYTGWNTRYDEWVPKERIAENLTNNKTNKRTKTASKAETRSNSMATEKLSSVVRSASKRNRIGSKNEIDQPQRSTTPSSIASNSSRTKSPATPAQHRRTTRGQPNKLRRTSNNTDISSIQTDSDSDSDEPVVKKPTPKRKPVNPKIKSKSANNAGPSDEIKKRKYSNASSEEEPLANTVLKNREAELNQSEFELKGFNEVKKLTIETRTEAAQALLGRKLDYVPKSEPSTPNTSKQPLKHDLENSSDSDSSGDEDLNISDKPTNSEINFDNSESSLESTKNELIEKVATLKQSGIEKIIKNTLAEKPKSLPEKPSMKTLIERKPIKHIEKDEESKKYDSEPKKQVISEMEQIDAEKQCKEQDIEKSKTKDSVKKIKIEAVEESKAIDAETSHSEIGTNEKSAPAGAQTSKQSPEQLTRNIDDELKIEPFDVSSSQTERAKNTKPVKQSTSSVRDQTISVNEESDAQSASLCDIYEFKEPEPFDYETPRRTSPESDKKAKRKGASDVPDTIKRSTTPPVKRTKRGTIRDTDKVHESKSSESTAIPVTALESEDFSPVSIKVEIESQESSEINITEIVESPAKDICQMATTAPTASMKFGAHEKQQFDSLSSGCEPSTSTSVQVYPKVNPCQKPEIPISKPLFISTFVETKIEEKTEVFGGNIRSDVDEKEVTDNDLESVKKIMLTEEVLNQEPPKIEKPSSIADKVLKALNSQQHSSVPDVPAKDLEQCEDSTGEKKSGDSKQKANTISADNVIDQITIATDVPPKNLLASTVLRTSEQTTLDSIATKSVLNKIDILESISPKNNDLSETIQKLESVIQQKGDQSHISEDSSDSTDSEQRLIIEDEYQSVETYESTQSKQEADSIEQTIKDTPNVTLKSGGTAPEEMKESIIETPPVDDAIEKRKLPVGASDVIKYETIESKKPNDDNPTVILRIEESSEMKKEDLSQTESIQNESLSLLLCEETIPGSPAPACSKEQYDQPKKNYDNIFISPHSTDAETKGQSIESEKGNTDKIKEKNVTPVSSPRDSMSQDESSEDVNKKQEHDRNVSPKKRRCARKQSESESTSKRRKPIVRRNTITGSDSEDNSEMTSNQRIQRPTKTCQYNFLVQLDPAMNSNQRITLLKKKIQDLRKTYNMIKTELASIDRRRKKLRRRDRELKRNAHQSTSQSSHQPQQVDQRPSTLNQQSSQSVPRSEEIVTQQQN